MPLPQNVCEPFPSPSHPLISAMDLTSLSKRVGWLVGLGFFGVAACGPTGADDGRPNDLSANAGGNGGEGAYGGSRDGGSDPFEIAFPDALAMLGGANGGRPDDTTTDALMPCGSTAFRVERTPPDVLIVLDRSGSMMRTSDNKNPLDPNDMVPQGTPVRWSYTYEALKSVLESTQSDIAWGLKMFPTCRPGVGRYQCEPNACHIEGGLTLPDIDQGTALSNTISMAMPRLDTGATPMAPALDEAVSALKQRMGNNRPKYILLATDGIPNCGVDAASQTRKDSVKDEEGAIASVRAAKAAGFDVFVLGIGFMDPTLNKLAEEGGRARPGDTKYYSANDGVTLKAALAEISAATVSCTIALGRQPPEEAQARVDVDDAEVTMDVTDGWGWASDDRTSITLNGSYCTKLKKGELKKTVVSFGCPGKPIPPPPPTL